MRRKMNIEDSLNIELRNILAKMLINEIHNVVQVIINSSSLCVTQYRA